jgi:4'-phosphopantetheinyl transferase
VQTLYQSFADLMKDEPRADIPLADDEIHVWRVRLHQTGALVKRLFEHLSADERHRAGSLRFPVDRERFVVARGALRNVLSRYANCPPEALRFSYGAHGKPTLASESGGDQLRFNLSHSHELALIVVTRRREVGIDIEFIRDDFSALELAGRFFSGREAATLRALPAELQFQAFFNCWTRKEAYIKARGAGLSLPLKSFEVSMMPGAPAVLLHAEGDSATQWFLHDLPLVEPGYAAALAVEQPRCAVTTWHHLE